MVITADAVEAAHTVTTSQLLNEFFAKEAGLENWQLGLGHAFEIDPDLPNSFRMELAHALLARELFPDAPLKWMPPTRHMSGDVFRGNLLDGFFNLIGSLTGQGILLVGMMTEAVVTPWLSDRDIALQNVRYVLEATGDLHEDFRPAPDGFIANRARQVLGETIELLEAIVDPDRHQGGLLDAIADGTFGLMRRPADAGRGLDGVAKKSSVYTTRPRTSWRPTVAEVRGRPRPSLEASQAEAGTRPGPVPLHAWWLRGSGAGRLRTSATDGEERPR